jgi:hypothetical protein
MHKLKKAAAVAVMVGGIGLIGGGVASAHGGGYDDPFAIDNLQAVDCEQSFDAGGTPPVGAIPGVPGISIVGGDDQEANVGNFCTVIGSIED